MSHLLGCVDVQALVEMLLQVGHHGVVPGHAVDAGVLQAGGLHHAAAHLHDQRDKLHTSSRTRTRWEGGHQREGGGGVRVRGSRREREGKLQNYKVRLWVESNVEAASLSLHGIMHNEIAGSKLMVVPESRRVKLTRSSSHDFKTVGRKPELAKDLNPSDRSR